MRTTPLKWIALVAVLGFTACSGGGSNAPPMNGLPPANPGFSASPAAVKIAEFPIAPGDSNPAAIAVAGDGSAWFLSSNAVNRIALSGAVTPHADPEFSAYSKGTDIIAGTDGALWFTANCSGSFAPPSPINCDPSLVELLRITTAGSLTFIANAGDTSEGVFQSGLAFGPDSTISAIVGRGDTVASNGSGYEVVKTDGTVLRSEPFPSPCLDVPGTGGATAAGFWSASGIARGSDGAFYVTASPPCGNLNLSGAPPDSVLRIDASGAITNVFPLPNGRRITAGPDGNLWITQNGATNAIARMTTTGSITEFPIPTPNANPIGIAVGNDGAIWFAEHDASKFGRITLDGKIVEYRTPTANAGPFGVASLPGACGPGHGQIWFTESLANKVARIDF